MHVVRAASGPLAWFFLADIDVVLGGFNVAFEGNGRNRMVWGLCRQASEAHAVFVLLEIYCFAGIEEAGRLHLRLQTCHNHIVAGPKVHMHVERVTFARETRVVRAPWLTQIRRVDTFTVAAHPLSDFRQYPDGFFGDAAVSARPDVQQIVPGVTRA